MRASRHEHVHVSVYNLRTEKTMKLSYGTLDCPWIGLYDEINDFVKSGLTPPPPPGR